MDKTLSEISIFGVSESKFCQLRRPCYLKNPFQICLKLGKNDMYTRFD